jgi:hypothetical protein
VDGRLVACDEVVARLRAVERAARELELDATRLRERAVQIAWVHTIDRRRGDSA